MPAADPKRAQVSLPPQSPNMSEPPNNTPEGTPPIEVELAREKTKQVEAAGWTAGVTGLGSIWLLSSHPEWPMAAGVVAVAAMVGYVCFHIVRR